LGILSSQSDFAVPLHNPSLSDRYDLAFQFEPVQAAASKQQRAERDLLLFLPDEILVVDGHSRRGEAWKVRYDFASASKSTSTAGLPRDASKAPFRPAAESSSAPFRGRELPQGDYAKTVERAKEQFKV
jgi:anthranilate synthase